MAELEGAVAIANACSEQCPNPGCSCRVVSMRPGSPSIWECSRCSHPVQISPARSSAETRVLELIAAEDEAPPDKQFELFRRGLTVRLLNTFTVAFQCWDWPTWRVVRDIVVPATAARRGRYFDLLEEAHPGECGPPGNFISHAWAAKWGALVGAASFCSHDGDRRVWIDVFAVRQWPGSPIDLDFRAVIDRCGSLILAISHEVLEEANLDRGEIPPYQTAGTSVITVFDAEVRRKLPLARSWCLIELVAAYRARRNVVALAGESVTDTTSPKAESLKLPAAKTAGQWAPVRAFAVSSFGLIEVLSSLIRMEDAESSSDVDRNRIHADVQNSIGFLEFNASVRAALLSASIDPSEAEVVLPLLCDSDDQLLRQRAALQNDKARLLSTLAATGLEQAVAVLIEEFDYDFEDTSMPALWAACSRGHLRVARMLVDRYHASVEGRAGNRMTPLAAAASGAHADVVTFLLDRGAAVNARARLGRSAMMAAAIQGNTRILAILREAGAYADLVDDDGQTALTHAIDGLHTDAVRFLITACAANVCIQPDPECFSPLHWAAFRGSRDIAKLLIDNGGNIEARAVDDTPPLVSAAMNGHPDVVALLIHAGADVGATNDSGWGVVDCAVSEGHLEVLEVIAAEVPPTKLHLLRNPAIRALNMAIKKQNPAIVAMLVKKLGWSVDPRPGEPLAPVIAATYRIADDQSESISILADLISAGADVTVRDGAGASVLFSCKSLRALQVLTSRPDAIAALQTIINERLADGRSALHFAAAGNHAEVVRGLTGILGAKIDLAGPSGATPLVLAIVHDAVASARVLLEEGADIHIKTPDGRRLLELARESAGDEMVALIKAYLC